MSGLKKGKKRQFVSLPSQDDITVVEHPDVNKSSISKIDDQHRLGVGAASPISGHGSLDPNLVEEHGRLRRGLSARQVQMIAIGGEQTPSIPESTRTG